MAQCEGLHWLSRMGGGPRSTLRELAKSRVPGVQEHPRNPHSQSFRVFLVATIASSPIAVKTVALKGNRNSIWAPLAIKHNTQTSNTLYVVTIYLLYTKKHLNTAMVIWFAIYNLLHFNLNVFLFWVCSFDRWTVNEQTKTIKMKNPVSQSSFLDENRCIWQRNATSSVAVLCHQL